MQHDQHGFLGEHARLPPQRRVGRGQHQRGLAPMPVQAHADIVQQQPEIPGNALQALPQRAAADDRMAQHGKAAALHAARILAEELIVQRGGDPQPQLAVAGRRDARLRHRQQFRRDAGAAQHRPRVDPARLQPGDGMVDKTKRDAAFFHGPAGGKRVQEDWRILA
ncbi:hypothetical protein D9M68_611850 [compost metagenome]